MVSITGKPTLREKAAHALDDGWNHSWHWPERDWEGTALEQAHRRVAYYTERLSRIAAIMPELKERSDASGSDTGKTDV